MNPAELREKAHKLVDAVPDDRLEHFVSIIEQIMEIPDGTRFDAHMKRIIEEKRELLKRLAQ